MNVGSASTQHRSSIKNRSQTETSACSRGMLLVGWQTKKKVIQQRPECWNVDFDMRGIEHLLIFVLSTKLINRSHSMSFFLVPIPFVKLNLLADPTALPTCERNGMWTSWPAIPNDQLRQVSLPPFLPNVRPHLEIWKSGQWPVPLSPWVFSRPPAAGKTRKNDLGCCRHTELLSPVVGGRCHWVWWFSNLTICHAQEICHEKTRRTSQSVWCHHGPSLARPGIMLSQLFLCSCKDVPQPPRSQFETSAEAKTAAKRKKTDAIPPLDHQ